MLFLLTKTYAILFQVKRVKLINMIRSTFTNFSPEDKNYNLVKKKQKKNYKN